MSDYTDSILSTLDPCWAALVAKVLQDCRNPPNAVNTPEEFYPFDDEIDTAAFLIKNALEDCVILDHLEGSKYFSERFHRALSSPVAWAGIMWKIRQPLDGRKSESVTIEDHIIARIREKVRDGFPIDYALSGVAPWIEKVAVSGGAGFFARTLPRCIADIQKRPELYNRSLKDWLRRAWIPLGLWLDVADPRSVHTEIERAAKLIQEGSLRNSVSWPKFYAAWSKVKPIHSDAKRLPECS